RLEERGQDVVQAAGVEVVGPPDARLRGQPGTKRLKHSRAGGESHLLEERDGQIWRIAEQTVVELPQRGAPDRQGFGRGGGGRRGAHLGRELRVWPVRGARVRPRRGPGCRALSPSRAW